MERQDDPRLSGKVRLWRRIPPWAGRIKQDQQTGELRPSSMNFRDKIHELSVYLAEETTVAEVLRGHEGFGIVEFTAEEVRTLLSGVILCRDPQPHPAHVLICGKVTASQSERLAKLCASRWVVKPRDVPADPTV